MSFLSNGILFNYWGFGIMGVRNNGQSPFKSMLVCHLVFLCVLKACQTQQPLKKYETQASQCPTYSGCQHQNLLCSPSLPTFSLSMLNRLLQPSESPVDLLLKTPPFPFLSLIFVLFIHKIVQSSPLMFS